MPCCLYHLVKLTSCNPKNPSASVGNGRGYCRLNRCRKPRQIVLIIIRCSCQGAVKGHGSPARQEKPELHLSVFLYSYTLWYKIEFLLGFSGLTLKYKDATIPSYRDLAMPHRCIEGLVGELAICDLTWLHVAASRGLVAKRPFRLRQQEQSLSPVSAICVNGLAYSSIRELRLSVNRILSRSGLLTPISAIQRCFHSSRRKFSPCVSPGFSFASDVRKMSTKQI